MADGFERQYALSPLAERSILVFPILIFLLFATAMSLDATQDFAFKLVKENNVVDWLTSGPALLGGILGLRLAAQERARGKEPLLWLFYLVFALGLLFLAGEETKWGQDFFHYPSPGFFERYNEQGDVSLHNLDGMNARNHYLRLAFGAGGLIGLLAWRKRRFRDLAPPRVLQVWFWLIALKSVLDIFFISSAGKSMPSYIIAELSEVIEMLVAMAGFLYVWLNGRRLAQTAAVRASG